MGYTHYWRSPKGFTKTAWSAFTEDVKKILQAVQDRGIKLCREFNDVNSPPIVNQEKVFFNGAGDDGHETFVMTLEKNEFDFCKTARKDYDLAVCACLILAKHHFGDSITVSTGGHPAEWRSALELVRSEMGKGDFPFARKEVFEGFTEGYRDRYVEEYDQIREALNI